ncbi:hypothetical protein ACA910_020082 [Epithemia clementina (nom. ined.)]
MARPQAQQQQQQLKITSSLSPGQQSQRHVNKSRVVLVVVGIAFIVLIRSFDFGGGSSHADEYQSSTIFHKKDNAQSSSNSAPLTLKFTIPPRPWPGQPLYELDLSNADNNRVVRVGPDRGPMEHAQDFLHEQLNEFLKIYSRRPDPANACGGRLNHQFALYMITKQLQPTTIIESGVYAGQSTYMFRQASNSYNSKRSTPVKIISLDPTTHPECQNPPSYMDTPMDMERWIDTTNNEYLTGTNFVDFDSVNWAERIANGELDPATTLIFMDDHQGFYRRFDTFLKHGFRYIIHDDNFKLGHDFIEGDTWGDTPKQMWRKPNSAATQWLYKQALIKYAEFPPILSPRLTHYTGWKQEPGFLYHTDDFRHYEEPLLQPEFPDRFQDQQAMQQILQTLQIVPDIYRQNRLDYFELFQYSYLCFLELNPEASRPPPPL